MGFDFLFYVMTIHLTNLFQQDIDCAVYRQMVPAQEIAGHMEGHYGPVEQSRFSTVCSLIIE